MSDVGCAAGLCAAAPDLTIVEAVGDMHPGVALPFEPLEREALFVSHRRLDLLLAYREHGSDSLELVRQRNARHSGGSGHPIPSPGLPAQPTRATARVDRQRSLVGLKPPAPILAVFARPQTDARNS